MKLAIFPGTFNPVHIAHLIIAESAWSQCRLDKVLFVTSCIPPHRSENIAPASERHEMVELCCSENDHFEVSTIEIDRKGPSYTYKTVENVRQIYNITDRLYFLIGADAIGQLHTWHEAQQIVDSVHFLVFSRPGQPDIKECIASTGLKNFKYDVIEAPLLEISSTLIRNNISSGKSIKFLVLDNVRNYIETHNLYKETLNGGLTSGYC
jgi:nicotinate-nucleotide adenylyltransferase